MRIGLLDAMGYGNLGDAAIQDSVIYQIRRNVPNAYIAGFSFVPADTTERHGIPCFPITRDSAASTSNGNSSDQSQAQPFFKSAVKRVPLLGAAARRMKTLARECQFLAQSYKTLRSLDLLVISGGGQLCELWGGPWAHPFNLFKFSILTKLARRRLFFLNVGAEPMTHRLTRFFIKCSLRMADYVSLRDHHSQSVVQKLGLHSETYVRPDPAYALVVTDYIPTAPNQSSKTTVGVNPMGFCDPRVWPHKDLAAYDAYLQKLVTFSLWLLEQGYTLKVFTTSAGVDKYAVTDLKNRLAESNAVRALSGQRTSEFLSRVELNICGSVPELLRVISDCSIIVTSKYHGVILSQILNKPVIATSYQTKIDAAMAGMGQEEFCKPIEHFGTDWLINAFRQLLGRAEAIKSHQSRLVSNYERALCTQFEELFAS